MAEAPGITLTAGAFPLHRRRVWLSLTASVIGGLALVLIAAFLPPLWSAVLLAVAAGLFGATAMSIALLRSVPAPLIISAEGLYYWPFAKHAAPWSEITAIAHVQAYSRYSVLGRTTWTRQPSAEHIQFDLHDLRKYPNGLGRAIARAMHRLGGVPPIAIQLWIIDAEASAIRAEIRKYWPGHIVEVDPRVGARGAR